MIDVKPQLALAPAIRAVGKPAFPQELLTALHLLAGTDLCSAFEVGSDGTLRYLFAAGCHPEIPDFAESASLAYARDFWRRDRTTRRTLAQEGAGVRMVRQAWSGIADPDYRRACYERGDIGERVTLYGGGPQRVITSAYRLRESGHSRPDQLDLLETFAEPLVALVQRHAELLHDAPASAPNLHATTLRFLECGRALSPREAVVAAAMTLGHTQKEISRQTGLALSSIVTYRRRAYRKLGASDRRALQGLLRDMG